jgi:hypothetical protein
MKSLNLILIFFVVAIGAMFTSCGESDDATPPEITIAGDSVAKAGSVVYLTITVGSDADLKSISVSPSTTGGSGSGFVADSDFDKDSTSTSRNFVSDLNGTIVKYNYVVPSTIASGSTITLTFTVTDKETSNTAIKTITVGSTVTPIALTSWTSEEIGAQSNAKGSSMVALTGKVYTGTQLAADASLYAKIDLIAYYSGGFLLESPNVSQANTTPFTTKNTTKLYETSMTAAQFTSASTNADVDKYITGTSVGKITLTTDKVFAFVSANGYKGLIKVKSAGTSASGSAFVDGKVYTPSATKSIASK